MNPFSRAGHTGHRDLHREFHMHGRGGFGSRGRGPGGRGGRGFGGDEEGMLKRLLGHGDLRFVILSFLEEKPSHGYELIKTLEEKSSGQYTPSPGVIYPTLIFLEEGGFATSETQDSNKKQYSITKEGKKLLAENREHVDAIMQRLVMMGERMSKLREFTGREEEMAQHMAHKGMGDNAIRTAFHTLKHALFGMTDVSKEKKKKAAEIIEKAAEEIKKL